MTKDQWRPKHARCIMCRAEVIWVHTKDGRAEAIDKHPEPYGDYVVEKQPGREARLELYSPLLHPGAVRFQRHFRTCGRGKQ